MLNIESFLGCDTYTSPLSTCLSMSVFSSCFCFYHSFFPACLCVSISVQVDICETRVLAPVFENRNAVSLPSNNYIRILRMSRFHHSLSVCLSVSGTFPSLFSSLSWFTLPATSTHMHPHPHTSFIPIPERSRLVWTLAVVGLCPWTQWHPCHWCIELN